MTRRELKASRLALITRPANRRFSTFGVWSEESGTLYGATKHAFSVTSSKDGF
jgi:hypothetical protein